MQNKTTAVQTVVSPHITVLLPSVGPNTRTRVAAYCRVSTDSAGQLHSYEAQKRYFTALYAGSPDYELVGIYADRGFSGTGAVSRPAFGRLLEDCRRGAIDRVVCKSISRFARNTKECLIALRELKQLGVSVCFEKEGIDTARISDEIMITVMEGLAQEESASISRNVRWSLKRKMAAGTLRIARVPYGYRKEASGELTIDEERAAVVRQIFALYLSGCGARRIALALRDEGILSPTGKPWSHATILKMLAQEKYTGDIRWQKTYSVFPEGKSRINTGEADSYCVRGRLPAIIDRETFLRVQALRAASASSGQSRRVPVPFGGRLRCTCGRTYHRVAGRQPYWVCGGRTDLVRPCAADSVPDARITAAWERLCHKLSAHGDRILLPLCEQLRALEERVQGGALRDLEAQADELRQRRYLLCQLCAEGCISRERSLAAAEETEAALSRLSEQAARMQTLFYDAAAEVGRVSLAVKTASPERLRDILLDHAVIDGDGITFRLHGGLYFREVL